MSGAAAFQSLYRKLNPAQKLAVDTIEGPVMVVAGPGTGKTQVLVARIAHILATTDTQPSAILALTFTESAANTMRKRLVSLIGKAGYYVQISTFHAYCQEVISSHPESFPIDRDSQALSDLERYELVQNIILAARGCDDLKPLNRPLFYIKDIIQAVSQLKREGVSPLELQELVAREQRILEEEGDDFSKTERFKREKNVAKQLALGVLYTSYESELRLAQRFDFDDMIGLVADAFTQDEVLRLEYQENAQYVLVDEYQDTNTAQNTVVQQLTEYWGDQANVFVVGDPHQSIYRFQGASVENVAAFTRQYPSATVITLTIGYRCPQSIYDAAHHLIGINTLAQTGMQSLPEGSIAALNQALGTRLISAHGQADVPAVFVQTAPTATLELIAVANQIQALVKTGVSLGEIAILYRYNSDAVELNSVLAGAGIACREDGGSNVLESEPLRQLFELFTLIADLRSGIQDERLFEVACYSWIGLDSLSIMQLTRLAGQTKTRLYDLMKTGSDSLEADARQSLQAFITHLNTWSTLDSTLTFPEWFELVMTESGYLGWVITQLDKPRLLYQLNAVFSQVKALAAARRGFKLADFLQALTTMLEHGIPVVADVHQARSETVTLTTAHKAKGQEWPYVFVIHCLDGKWGNARQRELLTLPDGMLQYTDTSKKERNEDERRLFYVAITRASKQVYVSYPQALATNGRSREVVRSMFIDELSPDPIATSNFFEDEESALTALESAFVIKPAAPKSDIVDQAKLARQKAFFSELVDDFKLSVTALNTYLRDPREFVLNSLLRIPRAKPEHMAFGTAVHSALETLYLGIMKTGEIPDLSQVQRAYAESLERELLTSHDFERRLIYGQELLGTYHARLVSVSPPLFVERFFGGGSQRSILANPAGPIQLTGRIDRVDWVSQSEKTVKLVDYKTGKAKSQNDILGKTVAAQLSERELELPESIRGPYKRQLLFYKLLTQLDPTFLPTAVYGEFEFVEPDKQSGKTVTRTFELIDEEVEDLKQLIVEVMAEIKDLAFLSVL